MSIQRLNIANKGAFGSEAANMAKAAELKNAPKINIQSDNTIDQTGLLDLFPVPPAMTKTVTSATGGGAVAKTTYFGNEDAFNASPTNNESGANSMVNTYGDGFSGKSYNRLFAQPTIAGSGLACYGFTFAYVVTNGGAQDGAGLTTANPTILVANGTGSNMIPRGTVLSAGLRNTQYLPGTMTVRYSFTFNSLMQISYNIPVGDSVTATIMTQPF